MLFFLFSDQELRALFTRLGYDYDPELTRRTIDYYDRRTSHGSTLSLVTHAGVLAGLDPNSSWERFLRALDSDIEDGQGGTTKEGIHMGVMSGTLDLLQRYYVGSDVRDGILYFAPTLLDRLDGLAFSMQFRATPLRVSIAGHELPMGNVASGLSLTFRYRPERDPGRIPGWSPEVAGGAPRHEWRFRTARTRAGCPCA
jgi:trehalose/maltose hydrolase-like predicted phosphorylase